MDGLESYYWIQVLFSSAFRFVKCCYSRPLSYDTQSVTSGLLKQKAEFLYQIQMKTGVGDVRGGEVNEAANGKGSIVAFRQQEIKQTVRIV